MTIEGQVGEGFEPVRKTFEAARDELGRGGGAGIRRRATAAGLPKQQRVKADACARWSVEGAEAVLKLRAVRANDDFDDYWRFHLDKERHRVHETRFADDTIPTAA